MPKANRDLVRLSEFEDELLELAELPLPLGVSTTGEPVVLDLVEMPHLLVAGTTGSGKSVGLNAILSTWIRLRTPEQLRLVLIDPKVVGFSQYRNLAHLLKPVITQSYPALYTLFELATKEMPARYALLDEHGVDDISKLPMRGIEPPPRIVIVVEELAGLMLSKEDGPQTGDFLRLLAEKARAAGIHLVLATQRPTVDIVPGNIKANIPGRVAYRLPTSVDSQVAIGFSGAQSLLGNGDMLVVAPSITTGGPRRLHGPYVTELEVKKAVDRWQLPPEPDRQEGPESHEGAPDAPEAAKEVERPLGADHGDANHTSEMDVRPSLQDVVASGTFRIANYKPLTWWQRIRGKF